MWKLGLLTYTSIFKNWNFKSLKYAGSVSLKQYKKIKAVGSRLDILYGLCKVHKAIVHVRLPFRPVFSAIGTPFYIAKFLVPILSCLTINKFTEKDYFLFGKEIAEQGSSFYMGSLGVDLLFGNIPFEEVINFCIESLFDQNDIAEGLNKSEFKELLWLATKFVQTNRWCSYGLTIRTTLANVFLCFYEKKG